MVYVDEFWCVTIYTVRVAVVCKLSAFSPVLDIWVSWLLCRGLGWLFQRNRTLKPFRSNTNNQSALTQSNSRNPAGGFAEAEPLSSFSPNRLKPWPKSAKHFNQSYQWIHVFYCQWLLDQKENPVESPKYSHRETHMLSLYLSLHHCLSLPVYMPFGKVPEPKQIN